MNVLVVEPGYLPYEKEIDDLPDMKKLVGGPIQAIYPFLPFVHTMGAFESCIAGGWVSQFVQPTLITLAFLIPSLTLGLVLRRPIMRLAQWFDSQLEKSKLIFRE